MGKPWINFLANPVLSATNTMVSETVFGFMELSLMWVKYNRIYNYLLQLQSDFEGKRKGARIAYKQYRLWMIQGISGDLESSLEVTWGLWDE